MSKLTAKMVGSEEERAVSPVIGVILMVAITVILAAVIAAFVLDIGPGDTDPSASYETDIDGNEVEVTLNSLGSGTDGIVVVDDLDEDEENGGQFSDRDSGSNGEPLTVSGESGTYEPDNTDSAALVAYSGGDDPSSLSEVDNYAIIDNLEDLD